MVSRETKRKTNLSGDPQKRYTPTMSNNVRKNTNKSLVEGWSVFVYCARWIDDTWENCHLLLALSPEPHAGKALQTESMTGMHWFCTRLLAHAEDP